MTRLHRPKPDTAASLAEECRLRAKHDPGARCGDLLGRVRRLLLRMDRRGYTLWRGGKRPVPPKTIVSAKLRDGCRCLANADRQKWTHTGRPNEVVAYKVLQEHELAPLYTNH